MFAAILCESGVFGLNATETQGEREQAVVRGPGQSFSVGSLAPVWTRDPHKDYLFIYLFLFLQSVYFSLFVS